MRTCDIDDCERQHIARGMCRNHYNAAWKAGIESPKALHRLSSVDIHSMCALCSVCGITEIRLRGTRPLCLERHGAALAQDAARRQRIRSNPAKLERHREYHREYTRRWNFKLAPGGREELLEMAGRECQICEVGLTQATMRIDHDHACCPGQKTCGDCVRGVLCSSCNTGIGLLGDTADALRRALQYLAAQNES